MKTTLVTLVALVLWLACAHGAYATTDEDDGPHPFVGSEHPFDSESIVVAEYRPPAKADIEQRSENGIAALPALVFHIAEVLKGPPLTGDIPVKDSFGPWIFSKSKPPEPGSKWTWSFSRSSLPDPGSKWILFIAKAKPVPRVFETRGRIIFREYFADLIRKEVMLSSLTKQQIY